MCKNILTFSRSWDIRGRTRLTPYKTTSAADTDLFVACPGSCPLNTSSVEKTKTVLYKRRIKHIEGRVPFLYNKDIFKNRTIPLSPNENMRHCIKIET